MKSNLNIICLFLMVLVGSFSLYVQVDQAPFCVEMSPLQNSQYKLHYESVSEKSTLQVTISSNSLGRVVLHGYTNQRTLNASQNIEICFRTESKVEPVSIDIYPTQQQKYKALALKSQVHQVHEQLINVGTKLKQIAHHQRFQQQRQLLQSQIICKQEQTIFIYGVIKVALMVVVVVGQLLWVCRKLRRNGRSYFNF